MTAKQNFYQISVTTDVVLLTIEDDKLKVLLIERAQKPFAKKCALPGGFLHKGETSEKAARRILKQKAGVSNVYLEQLYTFDKKGRDPRGPIMSVVYYALIPRREIMIEGAATIQTPTFHDVSRLPKLAFDHSKIVSYALKRVRYKMEYTNIAYSLLPAEFTLSQLLRTYEVVWGRKLDKRNFQKKILSLAMIRPTGRVLRGGRQRPARLFRFSSRSIRELERFF